MRTFQSVAITTLLVSVWGCQDQQTVPLAVRGMIVNGYEFDFENLPTSIQADSQNVRIRTAETQIEVVDGALRIDGASYGKVKAQDRISVAGDKVSVNDTPRNKGD